MGNLFSFFLRKRLDTKSMTHSYKLLNRYMPICLSAVRSFYGSFDSVTFTLSKIGVKKVGSIGSMGHFFCLKWKFGRIVIADLVETCLL